MHTQQHTLFYDSKARVLQYSRSKITQRGVIWATWSAAETRSIALIDPSNAPVVHSSSHSGVHTVHAVAYAKAPAGGIASYSRGVRSTPA